MSDDKKESGVASIKDVAKQAGVSISTVSYALSGARPISQEKKDVIFQAMHKVGYKPNAAARALASKQSRVLGLFCTPHLRNVGTIEMEFIIHAAERASEHGYHVIIQPHSLNTIDNLKDLVSRNVVDGIIVTEIAEIDPRVEWLRKSEMPFEIIGRCKDVSHISYRDIDFYATMRQSLEHLYALGHRSIGFVNLSEKAFASGYGPALQSYQNFTALCKEFHIEGVHFFAESTASEGEAIIANIEVQHTELTALLTINDAIIPQLLQTTSAKGWSIPQDISLMSMVSSSQFGTMVEPQLTKMVIPTKQLMIGAVDSLIHRLEGTQKELQSQLLPCVLHMGGSTGIAKKSHRSSKT